MKRKGSLRQILLLLVAHFGIALFAANANAQTGDGAQWSVSPYFWASDTSLDISVNDTSVGGVDLSFADLLDMLDAAYQIQVEGGKGNWSGFADLTYLKLSDSEQRPIIRIDSDSKQVFLDAAVAYWPGGVGSPLNFYGGVRYSDLTTGMSLVPAGRAARFARPRTTSTRCLASATDLTCPGDGRC
jgi:hypothetical protein